MTPLHIVGTIDIPLPGSIDQQVATAKAVNDAFKAFAEAVFERTNVQLGELFIDPDAGPVPVKPVTSGAKRGPKPKAANVVNLDGPDRAA